MFFVKNFIFGALLFIDVVILVLFLKEILNEADTDKNGLIDYHEFFALMSPG